MPYVIVEPCISVKDKACVEVCPWTASTRAIPALHPSDECIDCGACEPVCPVKAIFARMRPRTSGELHRAQQENGSKTCLLPYTLFQGTTARHGFWWRRLHDLSTASWL